MTRLLSSTITCLVLSAALIPNQAQDAPSIWDGIYSAEQASRGEAVYREACLACHGQDLGGNSNSPGLIGMGFMFLWEGRSVGELFAKIQSEMPTDRPGRLPLQDYEAVVAFVLQRNGFPAGAALNAAASDMDLMRFEPQP